MLGCENLQLFEGLKPTSMKGPTDPIARLTSLGWMVGGRTYPEASTEVEGDSRMVRGEVGMMNLHEDTVRTGVCEMNNANTNQSCISDEPTIVGRENGDNDVVEELRKNLHRIWELETEDEVRKLMNRHYPSIWSTRQKQAETMLIDNLQQLETGQYQTRLLWSTDRRPHNNYVEAKKAFLNWERRLATDKKLHDAFHTAMANWINTDYLENTDNVPVSQQNFLTTFMVFKEQGDDTKARLVVNGARKFKGESLNDFLETGSNVMLDLSELLLRLRRCRHVVCCDLAEMFLNIKVTPMGILSG